MKITAKLALVVVLAAPWGCGTAAEAQDGSRELIPFFGGRFVVQSVGQVCVIALQGTITRDASLKFDDAIGRAASLGCANPWLLLESPGGGLVDGIDLGRSVRLQGLRTITRYDCSSSCALIFLGGTERWLVGSRARIGFHQASRSYRGREERDCDATPHNRSTRDIRRYLGWVIPAGADRLMELILGTSCKSIDFVGGQQALDLGVATHVDAEGTDVFGPRELRHAPPAARH
jgi:hypothetical protein